MTCGAKAVHLPRPCRNGPSAKAHSTLPVIKPFAAPPPPPHTHTSLCSCTHLTRPCRGGPSANAPSDKGKGTDKKDKDKDTDQDGSSAKEEGKAGEGDGKGKGGAGGGYAGKVRSDLDHRAYMPAAWRVDEYLDGEGEGEGAQDDLASLRQHRFEAAKVRVARVGEGGTAGEGEGGVASVGWERHGAVDGWGSTAHWTPWCGWGE